MKKFKPSIMSIAIAVSVAFAPVSALAVVSNPTVDQYDENLSALSNIIDLDYVISGGDLSALAQSFGAQSVVYQPEGGKVQIVIDNMTNFNAGNVDTFVSAFNSQGVGVVLSAVGFGSYQEAELEYTGGTTNIVPVQTDGAIDISSIQTGGIHSKVLAVELVVLGNLDASSVANGSYTSLLLTLLTGQVAEQYGPDLVIYITASDTGNEVAKTAVIKTDVSGDALALASASGATVVVVENTDFITDGDKFLATTYVANSGGTRAILVNRAGSVVGDAAYTTQGNGAISSIDRTNTGSQAGGSGTYQTAVQDGNISAVNITINNPVGGDLTKTTGIIGAGNFSSLVEELENQYDSHRGYAEQTAITAAGHIQSTMSTTAKTAVGGSIVDSVSNTGALNVTSTESNNLNLLFDSGLDLPSGAVQRAENGAVIYSGIYSNEVSADGNGEYSIANTGALNQQVYIFNAYTQFAGELNVNQTVISDGPIISDETLLSNSTYGGDLEVNINGVGSQNIAIWEANRLMNNLSGNISQYSSNTSLMSNYTGLSGIDVTGNTSVTSGLVGSGNLVKVGGISAP